MDNCLQKVETYCTHLLTNKLSEKIVYHDITHTLRLVEAVKEISVAEGVNEEEKEILTIAAWFINTGFTKLKSESSFESLEEFFDHSYHESSLIADQKLSEFGYNDDHKATVLRLLRETRPDVESPDKISQVLSDAVTNDWGKSKSKGRVKKLYEEFLLTGAVSYGKSTWYDTVLKYLREHEFRTEYAKNTYSQGKLDLISKVEKEKKDLDKTASTVLKKEMNITDNELKQLKKSLSSVKGRDDRGIQTLFRTTSRNHYTLSQMVDRKANIMISINAILLSLIISRTIGTIDTFCIHNSPMLIVLFSSIISMIFAIVAITPFKTQGTFTEKQIREKEGNLLYYGNIHKMDFRDYEWGMLEMLNDGNFLYSSMIRDLYHLGKTLHVKSRMIRISLATFIFGLGIAVIMFVIVASMSDFHIGSAVHN